MSTRRMATTILMLLLAAPVATLQAQQSAEELLRSALYEQEIRSDLKAAIRLYDRILAEHAGNRPVAARALVELAAAYEAIGNQRALDTYRRVLSEYPDQRDAADLARTRIAALAPAADAAPVVTDGVVARQLWVTRNGLGVGALSPDGRRVTFVDWGMDPIEGLRGHTDVAIYDVGSGRARLATDRSSLRDIDTYIVNAIWSPDGRELAYSVWDTTWTHQDLHVVGADGRGDRVLVDNEQFAELTPVDWSTHGFIAAVIKGWDGRYRIATVSVEDGATLVIKTLGEHPIIHLSVSPDGRFLAYEYLQAEGASEHDIFLLAVDGSSDERLAPHAADDDRAFFDLDGSYVAFISGRSGQNGLWAVPVKDGRAVGEPDLVRPDIGSGQPIGFTRAGLAYRVPREESDVQAVTLNLTGSGSLGQPEPLTTSFVGRNARAAWSPDGRRVAFLSRRGSGPTFEHHLVIRTLETGEERSYALPFRPFPQDAQPVWIEDGRAVAMEGGELDRTPSIFRRVSYRIDAASGVVEALDEVRSAAGRAGGMGRFTTDRQSDYLASNGLRIAGQRDLRRFVEGELPLRAGEDLLLVREGVILARDGDPRDTVVLVPEGHMHAWELSPDGATLAFARPADPERAVSNVLHIMPVTGGPPRELARLTGDAEFLVVRWLPDGKSVLYAAAEDDQEAAPIWHLDLETGESRPLDLKLDPRSLATFEFHPLDGRVALTVLSRSEELWVMDGFPWQTRGTR